MSNAIDSILELQVHDLNISTGEAVSGIVEAHFKGDDEGVMKSYEEYFKMDRLVDIGHSMIKGGLKEWNWQWIADEGWLCEKDWEWFKDELEKAKVSKEEFDKKWKAG